MTESERAAIKARAGVADPNVIRNDVRLLLEEVTRLRKALAGAGEWLAVEEPEEAVVLINETLGAP